MENQQSNNQRNTPEERAIIDAIVNPPAGMTSADAAESIRGRLDSMLFEYRRATFAGLADAVRGQGVDATCAELAASTLPDRAHLADLARAIGEGISFTEYCEYPNLEKWRHRDTHAEIARRRAEREEQAQGE